MRLPNKTTISDHTAMLAVLVLLAAGPAYLLGLDLGSALLSLGISLIAVAWLLSPKW